MFKKTKSLRIGDFLFQYDYLNAQTSFLAQIKLLISSIFKSLKTSISFC